MTERRGGIASGWPAERPTQERSPAERAAPLVPTPAPRRVRPPGQRLYDMPYSAVEPRLVNPAFGLRNLVTRVGHNAAYEIDVTLLDAPDHRLIRSGVLLAHRVLDGRGEWYLTAPDWQPLLPKDRIETMGHADLPEELADLIRPLRRRAALGPVAALRCDRREFALRADHGATVALLRDDKVTVRRGGLTTARYREVMLTPVGPGLDDEQTAWLDRALVGAGATEVTRFPRLVTRLGAPATSPSDVGEPGPFEPDGSFRRFVGQLVGLRLRRMVEADLAVRGGDLRACERLVDQARLLQAELAGVSLALAASWPEEVADELEWMLPGQPLTAAQLATRIRGERYLALLDRLVAAGRGPRAADSTNGTAAQVVARLVQTALDRTQVAVDASTVDPEDLAAWDEVRRAVGLVDAAAAVAVHVLPDRAAAVSRRLAKPRRLLARAAAGHLAATEVAGLTPEQAFAAGRVYEQALEQTRQARTAFVRAWTKAGRKLTG
ncbi:hypothetical protein [uncultured Friedmanniella sp.]|uniref:hypothetical protein n=1 Tax=uncultured Friedmanniella sp. TaxID=335381 RepID=UPI0035CB046F